MYVNKKRGQIQMGETVAVVVIVIILLIISIAFWSRISSSDIEDIKTQSQELSVIEIANIVSELPELKCYESGVNKAKCLDMYKIISMNESMKNDEVFKYYNNYFTNSKITIMKIYPNVETSTENITIYDAKLNNNIRTIQISIPINILDIVRKETIYGLIIVEGYYSG
jgi:hypothetical protein